MGNIYLCGFMGCGKSTVGKELARLTGRGFTDLDIFITEKQGMSIPKIFEKFGESFFREAESACLRELSENQGNVIALGGGALMRPENILTAKQSGKIIFLNPSFEICYERIKNDKNRPLAVSSTKEQLYNLFLSREPIYRKACDLEIIENLSPYMLARIISDKLSTL